MVFPAFYRTNLKNFYYYVYDMELKYRRRLLYIILFAASFAFVEAAVVVYLRDIYYPQGFHFPIKHLVDRNLIVELFRELATVIMMISVAALIGKKFWERFGYFLIIFGVWDILFYVFLKITLGWPESLFTWDILFLIPAPWIGPVLAPVIVSAVMIFIGVDITRMFNRGINIKPKLIHWIIVLTGSALILYTFTSDTDAGFREKFPQPYNWILFSVGILFYLAAQMLLRKKASHLPTA